MIVVDTSIWIDYLRGSHYQKIDRLEEILDTDRIIIGDLIITELMQGFRFKKDLNKIEMLIDSLEYRDMLGKNIATKSAHNYRELKKKGFTVRKTIDVMIGTFCIENKFGLLHNDRDFDPMENLLGLRSIN
jgi:predicted nucleic acid-binding protein